jgi:hypothetical protein
MRKAFRVGVGVVGAGGTWCHAQSARECAAGTFSATGMCEACPPSLPPAVEGCPCTACERCPEGTTSWDGARWTYTGSTQCIRLPPPPPPTPALPVDPEDMAALLAFESGGDPDNELGLSWTVDSIEQLGVRGRDDSASGWSVFSGCNSLCCIDADNRIVYLNLHGSLRAPSSWPPSPPPPPLIITGSLIDLADMTGLAYLRLDGTAASGRLIDLADLTSMAHLDLAETAVTGSLADITGLTSMAELDLHDTAITGSLADLAGMTGMTDLRLYHTAVTGSLADLSRMTSLEELYLFSSQSLGDDLEMAITGSLADLAGMTGMTHLYLMHTRVTGNLADLSGMAFMKELYLTGTAVSGDAVALLAALPRLNHHKFEFTSCSSFPCGSDTPCVADLSDANGACGAPTSCTTALEFTAFSNLVTTSWYIAIQHFAHFSARDFVWHHFNSLHDSLTRDGVMAVAPLGSSAPKAVSQPRAPPRAPLCSCQCDAFAPVRIYLIYCTVLRIRLSCEAKRFASRQTSLWRSGWLTSSTRLQRIAILDTSSLNDAPHQPFRVEPWAMDTQCLLYLLCQVDHGKFSFSSQSQRPQASLYLHTPFNRRQCLSARHGQRPSRDDRRGAL